MSGYRQHRFDPNAFEEPGSLLRPFNRVQWSGVAFAVAGLAVILTNVAGRLGWIAPLLDSSLPALLLYLVGIVLINSRREPANDVTPQQHAANRRLLIVTVGLCAIILGAATIVTLFTGAN